MILVYIAILAMLAMAGKPRRRRRMGRYIRGVVDEGTLMGALATDIVILGPFDETVAERTLISSIVATWSLEGTAGEGPIVFGVAHSDYSATEVQEYLDSTLSWTEQDMIAQERGSRKVRVIGTFSGANATEVFNDGRPVKTKLNWMLRTGQTLDMFVLNRHSATLTSGGVVECNGHANLWPR